ncbi:hypothetical protein L1987_53100 [Smallanthus sonchifolius]|uniref:Uncharacterized protein n=1 Tax=Smallanthus sonchifolius TaxID=185202 RepID=A0ACB9EV30_9ASTR|nr:hypothetical protein L1987_53100 [Smallanthus sonchifolius]
MVMYKPIRLVAKGFTQTQGIDYDETFSPVAMIKSIKILLAIAAYHDYLIWQMDVKTAFLNGHLSEDVYMVQPDGFVDPKYPSRVCKLNKSIYGLKQASRSWNLHFDQKIKEFGFVKNEDEPCVYRKASGSTISFLILYVDDILIIGNNIPVLDKVKQWLGSYFAMKDLGETAYILGIKIYRDRSERLLGLSQNLTSRMLKHDQPFPTKSWHCPLDCSQEHPELTVRCYTGASFQTDRDDSRSQSGFVFTLNGGAVSWKSSKQSVVADSTTEFEYIAASDAAKEAAWMKKFITDLDVVPSIRQPIEILCDNIGAIAQAKEPRSHHKAKHIQRKFHYIREIVERGDVVISKVDTDQNLTDPFTKPMT